MIHGTILKCTNQGILETAGYSCTGGIVGYSLKEGSVKQCSNYANLECENEDSFGGIVGCTNVCTVEECFNEGSIKGKNSVGGIIGESTYTTVQNCYNKGEISGVNRIGGIFGKVSPYEFVEGYEFAYNCYSVGMITGTNSDCLVGASDNLTYDHLYTIKSIYDVVGDGIWRNSIGTNWAALSGSDEEIKNTMLTNLQKEKGANKWSRDTNGSKNLGYPYLVDNE